MNKNFNKSTCAVCFEVKGEHSKTLNKITKGIEEKIATYIWPAYNLGISVCPSVICSNCRRNLFCLEKGSTEYLSKWMEKVSKVLIIMKVLLNTSSGTQQCPSYKSYSCCLPTLERFYWET